MLRAGLLTLAVVLAAAAPARAAFDVTSFTVAPASTAAGAHADVTIAATFPAYAAADPPQRPRNLTFHLPPGLAGDPFATPRCTEAAYRADACPAGTRVGSVAATATALITLLPVRQEVTGDLYNLVPAGREPARLGAVLRPTGGLLGKLFVPTAIRARAADGGLDSVVTDLPTALGGIQLYTERMAFTLQGRPGGKPFMRNPTSCRPATSRVVATPYGSPATAVTRTSTFTPAACERLPFSPHISGAVGANGQTARGAKPPVHTLIAQGAEQAGQSSVTVGLPPVLGVDLAALARACSVEQAAARACPDSARVGTVRAVTPLLAQPLGGAVYLAARANAPLPGLTIQLADPIPLRLEGTAELTTDGLKTTFTGLPDVPLSAFRLDLAGGDAGVFALAEDLCATPPPPVTAAFVAQSGRQAAETAALDVAGCTDPPRVAAADHAPALGPPEGARARRRRAGRPRPAVRPRPAAGRARPQAAAQGHPRERRDRRRQAAAQGAALHARRRAAGDAARRHAQRDGDARQGRGAGRAQAAAGHAAAAAPAARRGRRRRRAAARADAEDPPATALIHRLARPCGRRRSRRTRRSSRSSPSCATRRSTTGPRPRWRSSTRRASTRRASGSRSCSTPVRSRSSTPTCATARPSSTWTRPGRGATPWSPATARSTAAASACSARTSPCSAARSARS